MNAASPPFEVPEFASRVFSRFIAAEYAYFTPKGEPLTWPVTPYWYPDRMVLAVATGLAYPNKAKYAVSNPKVSLYFSDPKSSGLRDSPKILVQGNAVVLDEDIQENTDRYIRELREKFRAARVALNAISVKLLDFYLPRLWVEVTPVRLVVERNGTREVIGSPLASPPSSQVDEAVMNPELGLDLREARALEKTVSRFGEAVLTTKGSEGFPKMIRTSVSWDDGLITLPAEARLWRADTPLEGRHPARFRSLEASGCRVPSGLWEQAGVAPFSSAACLCFHRHTFGGVRFEAYMVRGRLFERSGVPSFAPQSLAGFFGNGLVFPFSVIPEVGKLRKRLHEELRQRGKSMPDLRIP